MLLQVKDALQFVQTLLDKVSTRHKGGTKGRSLSAQAIGSNSVAKLGTIGMGNVYTSDLTGGLGRRQGEVQVG